MAKIKLIFEELYRSFWNSWFKDILLMLMFSISLVMAVIMCSYYFDLGEGKPDMADYEDSTWYGIMAEMNEERGFTDNFTTVNGCMNMLEYYEDLAESKEHPIICINQNGMHMKETDAKELFSEDNYMAFVSEENNKTIQIYDKDTGDTDLYLQIKALSLNLGMYRNLGLKTAEGNDFNEQNLTLKKADDNVPIILGNSYKGLVQVGQVFDVMFTYEGIYTCRVEGILEKGAQIPEFELPGVDKNLLDSYIIFPDGVKVTDVPEDTKDIEKFAMHNYAALTYGGASVKVKDKDELNVLSDEFRKKAEEYGLPQLQIFGVSMGLSLLHRESAASIRIMLILSIVLMSFTLYGLFVTFYDKIQSNSRVYGIYLMNGASVLLILIPFLLEIAFILLPAICTSQFIFSKDNIGSSVEFDIILRTAYILVGLIFAFGAGFITFLMKGVDTERLVRHKY